ncbi:Replication stress response regulator SDE2 [Apodemus speciosus]|uniref:Replication stress response regulator SDE2 n=1 Tax=Apodemus speciosus TaxID=105296 RepID=A0ABQ0EG55_APOSI
MAEAAAVAWVRGPGTVWKALPCASAGCSVRDVIYRHCREQEIPVECFFVKCNGVLAAAGDEVQHGAVYSLEPRLRGGKGGFGSMLRALGAQIEKTTNREACRDLSGRRLRDVNHEKAMAEWVKQQAEREAEKEQRRLERLQRKLAEPAHCFASPDYQRQCHEMAERLEDSVLKGMQAASSKMVSAEITETRKRPNKSKTDQRELVQRKRNAFGLGMEGLEAAEGSSAGSSAEPLSWSSGPGTHSKSPKKLQNSETEPGQDILENTGSESGEPSDKEDKDKKTATGTEATPARTETESPEPTEKDQMTGVSGGERAATALSEEDRESVPAANLGEASQETQYGLRVDTVDLSAFTSAAELESLGLERLKCELMARGLKCGGTLQERAARLFSVRGLAKELIDPALFAKPSKGKKK